jgi:hypothetical protein
MEEATAKQDAEPRGHHFVPKCWLAGFTETGEKDGRLWVTDLSRQKQWPTNPEKAGRIRDFYRVSEYRPDPNVVEKAFSDAEAAIGAILRSLDRDPRPPNPDELDALLQFMALQRGRVPAFRPFVLKVLESITQRGMREALQGRETWAAALQKADIRPDAPGADYDSTKKFFESGEYNVVAETEWYVQRALHAAQRIVPSLRKRYWGTSFSPKGRFIGSDNPVGLDGPKGVMVGFKNADVVIYPASRHLFLYGTLERVARPPMNLKYFSHMNTMMLLGSDCQVYSHLPDFDWLDENSKHQTCWKLFSKSNF